MVKEELGNYYLNTRATDKKGKDIFFGMTKIGAGKASFHLMPVYDNPELLDGISKELKDRMQGRSCFNFTEYGEKLFEELGD